MSFSNDVIGLQALSSGRWLSAENGGGSDVYSYGAVLDAWEQFTISLTSSSPWKLVWADEFNGNSIDNSKWSFEVQRPGVNNEWQNYTNQRWENARVEDGKLVIEGRRDYFGGHEYSSARLKTQGKASWTYGRIEARIQLPDGRGTWPAFWMMPENQSRGWPCGEIDIMEHVGYDRDQVHAKPIPIINWKRPEQRTSRTAQPGATTGFHVYAAEWHPDRIDFFVALKNRFTWDCGSGRVKPGHAPMPRSMIPNIRAGENTFFNPSLDGERWIGTGSVWESQPGSNLGLWRGRIPRLDALP